MNKTSGGDGIPVELFQILKDDAVKVLHSICHQIGKETVATDWKRYIFTSNLKKGNEGSDYHTTVLISHANKLIFNIHQASLQQCEN